MIARFLDSPPKKKVSSDNKDLLSPHKAHNKHVFSELILLK